MGLFDWLFGKPKEAPPDWQTAETGNQVQIRGDRRLTVFPADGGWKFCVADVNDELEPFFSEVYTEQQAAQEEALRWLNREPAVHAPRWIETREKRRKAWTQAIHDREAAIVEIRQFLSENPTAGISALRRPEAKVASLLKHHNWHTSEAAINGVNDELLELAERQLAILQALEREIAGRLAEAQSMKKPRAPRASASTLEAELAARVDELCALFESSQPLPDDRRARLVERHMKDVGWKAVNEGITYGEASGSLPHLQLPEEEFRAFMKRADQNLPWQCDTVATAFRDYLQTGMTPPPHYAWRVVVLLSKAKDYDRERRFLAAWCRHFGNQAGGTFDMLRERAEKAGSLSE